MNEYRIFADLTRILLAFGGSSNCNGDLICWGPDMELSISWREVGEYEFGLFNL